jgi:hypothetical protein
MKIHTRKSIDLSKFPWFHLLNVVYNVAAKIKINTEHWWNDAASGRPKTQKTTWPNFTLFTTNPTRGNPGSNWGCWCDRTTTSHMGYYAMFSEDCPSSKLCLKLNLYLTKNVPYPLWRPTCQEVERTTRIRCENHTDKTCRVFEM